MSLYLPSFIIFKEQQFHNLEAFRENLYKHRPSFLITNFCFMKHELVRVSTDKKQGVFFVGGIFLEWTYPFASSLANLKTTRIAQAV